MSDRNLTFLTFENGDVVMCENPNDALAKIRAMPKIGGPVILTQQSLPSGFSQTLKYDPVTDDWMPSSNNGAEKCP